MSDYILAAYLFLTLCLAGPVWYVTGKLNQPTWVRVTLTVAAPFVLVAAIARRVSLGRW